MVFSEEVPRGRGRKDMYLEPQGQAMWRNLRPGNAWRKAGGLMGRCLGTAGAFLAGAQRPLLREGRASPHGWPYKGRPGDNAEVVLSEGRGVRVGDGRPDVCQGISWRTRGTGSLRGLRCRTKRPGGDGMSVTSWHSFSGMRSPHLREEGKTAEKGLAGEGQEMGGMVVFPGISLCQPES